MKRFLKQTMVILVALLATQVQANPNRSYESVAYKGAQKFYVRAMETDNGYYYLEVFDADKRLRMRGHAKDRNGEMKIDRWQYFYDDGKLESEGNYILGYKIGEWLRYEADGTKKANRYYNPGRLEVLTELAERYD